jgi:hypothetical protein
MSVATSFKTYGMYNGFPFCPTSVDPVADGYDYWTTLGGYNKIASDAATAVTAAQIELSKQNAMKLFWNLETVNGAADYDTDSLSVTELTLTPDPKDRVCETSIEGTVIDFESGPPESTVGINAVIIIVRMYDGSTFLGYGLRGDDSEVYPPLNYGFTGITAHVDSKFGENPEVGLLSMMVESFTGPADYDYIEVNGIHFVGYAGCQQGCTLDASVPSSVGSDASAAISSLEFFTYP